MVLPFRLITNRCPGGFFVNGGDGYIWV